jgi:SAM-dependent methyltransferase
MVTRHLDLGCGGVPRNPYRRDEAHGIDIALAAGLDERLFRRANLSVEPIPHADASFESVSAFDFFEHVPRVLGTADSRGTRFPFIELMNEIHRILKPGGRLWALTPAYPRRRHSRTRPMSTSSPSAPMSTFAETRRSAGCMAFTDASTGFASSGSSPEMRRSQGRSTGAKSSAAGGAA